MLNLHLLKEKYYTKKILELQKIIKDKFNLHPKIAVEIEFYITKNQNKSKNNKNNTKTIESIIKHIEKELQTNIKKEKGENQYEVCTEYSANITLIIEKIFKTKKVIDKVVNYVSKGDLKANFLPKPFAEDYGSAIHYHLSLHDNLDTNIFSNEKVFEKNTYIIYTISGILEVLDKYSDWIIKENIIEEKKRLVPNFMAPTTLSWGGNNRTTLIRIPDSRIENRRIEFRLASPITSVEKVVIILLYGAIYGISNKILTKIQRSYGNAY